MHQLPSPALRRGVLDVTSYTDGVKVTAAVLSRSCADPESKARSLPVGQPAPSVFSPPLTSSLPIKETSTDD